MKKSYGSQESVLSKIISHAAHSIAMNTKQVSKLCNYSKTFYASNRDLCKYIIKEKIQSR